MPKISNTNTEFLENVTAMALSQKELCEMLAQELDSPDLLRLLGDIYHQADKIRRSAINHRQHLREVRRG